ncbi:glycine receptor subunit alpha-2-like isoform X2 [Lineus longissimus]|uniref:glycine receptor subunit alpha-2-like isoform X2 n=1 Tax=Lineus longissimus TaxID=88925 RepID=UPI00315DB715
MSYAYIRVVRIIENRRSMVILWKIHIFLWELLYLLCKISYSSGQSDSESNSTRPKTDIEIFYHNLNDSKYDRRIPPTVGSGNPVVLKMDLFVQSVGEINEMQMASGKQQMVTMSVFFRMRWHDRRLKVGHTTEVVTDYELANLIWLPDPYFVNGEGEARGTITVPNRFFRVSPDGDVFYSQRITVPFACPMNLTYFPLDKQTCKLLVESYGHTTSDILFETMGKGIDVSKDIQIAQFKMTDFKSEVSVRNLSTGEFARLEITFEFERLIGHYIFTVYISSVLIICLSWVSFWLDVHAVPARISLGVLCVLTQTTQTMSILSTTPRVSYFKAIDIWMAACMFFTFCALVEFAIANSMARYMLERRAKREAAQQDLVNRQRTIVSNGNLAMSERSLTDNMSQCQSCMRRRFVDPRLNDFRDLGHSKKKKTTPLPKAHILDMVSRVVFPVAFICLNIGYWVTFKALPTGTVSFNS